MGGDGKLPSVAGCRCPGRDGGAREGPGEGETELIWLRISLHLLEMLSRNPPCFYLAGAVGDAVCTTCHAGWGFPFQKGSAPSFHSSSSPSSLQPLPGPSFAAQGASKLALQDGEGGRGEDWGEDCDFSSTNSRKWH